MSYEICYIDDRIVPVGAALANDSDLISSNDFSGFVQNENWEEPTVRRILSHTLKKGEKFKQIILSGFTHPDFFLNYVASNQFNPNSVILDWDYGGFKAEEKIKEIIDRTASKIFVITGNDYKPEVEETLADLKVSYPDRGLDVYKKASGIHQVEEETQENMLEAIIADLSNTFEKFNYNEMAIKFYPSHILPDFSQFWMLESVLGEDIVSEFLSNNSYVVSKNTIEKMFDFSKIKFFKNRTNSRIYTEYGLELRTFYGDEVNDEPMTPIYSINNYDLTILESACERGTSKTFIYEKQM